MFPVSPGHRLRGEFFSGPGGFPPCPAFPEGNAAAAVSSPGTAFAVSHRLRVATVTPMILLNSSGCSREEPEFLHLSAGKRARFSLVFRSFFDHSSQRVTIILLVVYKYNRAERIFFLIMCEKICRWRRQFQERGSAPPLLW